LCLSHLIAGTLAVAKWKLFLPTTGFKIKPSQKKKKRKKNVTNSSSSSTKPASLVSPVRVGDSATSMDESGSASSPLRPVTVDGADADAALAKSRFLTREEVLRRRLRRVKQLGRCYRAHYWALMEEMRSKYRDYSWTYGKSPFKEGHNETDIDNQNGGGVPALGGADDIVRCRFSGCKTKAMALTTYCHSHILSDSKQRLYHGCRAVAKKWVLFYFIFLRFSKLFSDFFQIENAHMDVEVKS